MNKKTILIADDDSDLLEMLSQRCNRLGLNVLRSPDATHALLGVHRARPDLILLDVKMPGGNGIAVCEMLASDDSLSMIPMIVMTAGLNEDVIWRCRSLGVQCVAKGTGLWERLKPLICQSLSLTEPDAPSENPATNVQLRVVPAEENSSNARPQILCIDDDPEISKIWKLRLEPCGVEVLRALNGSQGFATAVEKKPDMIILDMCLPDHDGIQLLGRLRAHPTTAKVPVLMLSGTDSPSIRREISRLEVAGFLTKPVSFPDLLQHIEKFVPLREFARPA